MTPDERVEFISMRIHEAWYNFTVSLLGESGVVWGDAPDWQKDSTRHLVRFYDEIDTSSMRPSALSGLAHAVWVNHKKLSGWKLGPVKDPVAKTHPSMIPFDQLSENEKKKDEVVIAAYIIARKELGEYE